MSEREDPVQQVAGEEEEGEEEKGEEEEEEEEESDESEEEEEEEDDDSEFDDPEGFVDDITDEGECQALCSEISLCWVRFGKLYSLSEMKNCSKVYSSI